MQYENQHKKRKHEHLPEGPRTCPKFLPQTLIDMQRELQHIIYDAETAFNTTALIMQNAKRALHRVNGTLKSMNIPQQSRERMDTMNNYEEFQNDYRNPRCDYREPREYSRMPDSPRSPKRQMQQSSQSPQSPAPSE